MASSSADASLASGQNLRPEPYMGFWRRLRVKGDDVKGLAIQWSMAFFALLLIFILVFACYFTLPSVVSSKEAGTRRFSEERFVHVGCI